MALRGPMATGMETASRKQYVSELQLLEPSAARFLALLTRLKKKTESLSSTDYIVQERRPRGQSTTITASYVAGDTTFAVASSAHMSVGDLLFLPARSEQVQVTAINSATEIVVTRGVGSTATSLTSGDALLRIARVMNEGYTVPSSFMTDTTQVTNYISTISTPVEWTNYQTKDQSYVGAGSQGAASARVMDDEKAAAIEHLREIDRQLLFSRKGASTDGSGRRLLTTQGMHPSIVTNSYNHSGGSQVTETLFNQNVVEPVWRNNGASSEKWALCANKTLTIFESFGIGRLQFQEVKSRDLGFEISGYRTTRGTLNVVHCPHLDVSYFDESVLIIDPNFVKLAIFQDTKYETDLQPKNVKTKLNEWSTMLGLWMVYEEAHGFAFDLKTAT